MASQRTRPTFHQQEGKMHDVAKPSEMSLFPLNSGSLEKEYKESLEL